ncbi:MAG: bifunctional DNA primase/polymerase [Desulfomonilaceae bacterium]
MEKEFIDGEENARLSAALELAQAGCPVIPLHGFRDGKCTCGGRKGCHPGKHPHITKPSKRATTKASQIIEWWKQWPYANVGLPTGKPFNRFVLDVDLDKGGGDSLKSFERKNGKLPLTQRTVTGNGFHYHFLYPADISIPSNAGKLCAGLDLRGEGGLVVVPNSEHESGRMYRWDPSPFDLSLVSAPDWLLDLIVNLQSAPDKVTDTKIQVGFFGQLILEGYRNETLFKRYACHLRDKGLSENYVLEICLALNAYKCSPPLKESEVVTLVHSAFAYPKRPSRRYGLSPASKKILHWLRDKTIGKSFWTGSVPQIMAGVGGSDRNIRRCVAQLERFNRIRVQELSGNIGSRYEVLPRDPNKLS